MLNLVRPSTDGGPYFTLLTINFKSKIVITCQFALQNLQEVCRFFTLTFDSKVHISKLYTGARMHG